MRKHITVGIRVTARRGEFLPKPPGKERAIRDKWYGMVTEYVEDNKWKVLWDNGQSTTEKSSELCVEPSTAGRIPLLQLFDCLPKSEHLGERQLIKFKTFLTLFPKLSVHFHL